MRPLVLPALLLALACALPAPAGAQVIRRCTGADGQAVFTDQPCAALDAAPATAAAAGQPEAPPEAPPPRLCAADAEDLRASVEAAFAAHNTTRLAGLFLWDDYAQGAALADIRALDALLRLPLAGVEIGVPQATRITIGREAPLVAPPRAGPAWLTLALADGDTRSWRIVPRAGCQWLVPGG